MHMNNICLGALLNSMLSSMVTSMELAEGCIRDNKEEAPSLEGLKLFAHAIDTGDFHFLLEIFNLIL